MRVQYKCGMKTGTNACLLRRYNVVLPAVVDHTYRFRYINAGAPGKCHDANVYARSRLSNMVAGGYFKVPVDDDI